VIAGVVGTMLVAQGACAQGSIQNVVVNLSSLSSGSPNTDEASVEFEISHDAGPGATTSFTSRYGFNINADSKSVSVSKLSSSVHEVSFEVHSAFNYRLLISTGWVGQIARQADTVVCADAAVLSGVTGQVIAGFGLSSGSLNLADPPDVTLLDSGDLLLDFGEAVDATIDVVSRPDIVQFHRLRFEWTAGVLSDTCEVAVRMGGPGGTTTECSTCTYPGDPAREQSADGHFVSVQFLPTTCGNGVVDSDEEECDLGAGNGFGACCTVRCELEPDDMPCSDGLFCNGDDRCAAGECVQPFGSPCVATEGCVACDEENDTCNPVSCTPTATPDGENTPTPPPGACVGDCNGSGNVSIDELVSGVNIALGQRFLSTCPAFDADGNGTLAINELVQAVDRALNGC
jgi:hypothetical protein